jgi:hypothetical protein
MILDGHFGEKMIQKKKRKKLLHQESLKTRNKDITSDVMEEIFSEYMKENMRFVGKNQLLKLEKLLSMIHNLDVFTSSQKQTRQQEKQVMRKSLLVLKMGKNHHIRMFSLLLQMEKQRLQKTELKHTKTVKFLNSSILKKDVFQ